MTHTLGVSLVALLFVTASLPGCRKDTEVTPQIQKFYEIAHSELAEGGDGLRAIEYLDGLPPREQLEVARVIANDPDIRIRFVGVDLLIEAGHEDEVIPALAAMVAQGQHDLKGVGYYFAHWIHSDDRTLFARMYVKIIRYLLAHLENYGGEERQRVERFMSSGVCADPSKGFSRAAVEQCLMEIEARVRAHRTTPAPPADTPGEK